MSASDSLPDQQPSSPDPQRAQYAPDIEARFLAAYERDQAAFVKPWMVSWDYIEGRQRRGMRFAEDMPNDFERYAGPKDLLKWLNWIAAAPRPDYLDDARIAPLVAQSRALDETLLARNDLDFDASTYDACIGRYNAQDFFFQNLVPAPERYPLERVLDFGAGYGRQANLWSQNEPALVYVGMDAVPLSYCLQHFYYAQLGPQLRDYALDPQGFGIEPTPGLYHLPTWRTDLLRDDFFDMIACVQVLYEINGQLLKHMIEVFARVLKPGGRLYIRDSEGWQLSHSLPVDKLLRKHGFVLELRPHVVNLQDLHGIPRVWRKADPQVLASEQGRASAHRRRRLQDLDARFGGYGRRIGRRLRG